MGWVDADAHVVESPRTWDYLTPSEQKYRPALFDPNDGTQRQNWVIDGKIRGLFRFAFTEEALVERSQKVGRQMTTSMETRDVANVGARLAHMDELGIDVQILYTSIFLDQCTERPEVDVALCGAYNRWLADIWKEGKGRLRWMCVLPFLSMPDAMDQLRFAKENGACGIFMRPMEGPRTVDDPYFFPIYEEASKLDLCIGLHQSNGNANLVDMLGNADGTRDFFCQYRIFNVGACFRLVSSGVPKTFPKLRFGFIETAASWIPWVVYELRRRMDTVEDKLPEDLLKEYNMYVTCQIGDDVPYLVQQAGEGTLMIGTDYGHADSSTELEALTSLREGGGISEEMHTRIVDDNPRQFYAL